MAGFLAGRPAQLVLALSLLGLLLLPTLFMTAATNQTDRPGEGWTSWLDPTLLSLLVSIWLFAVCGRLRRLLPLLALFIWLAPLEAWYVSKYGMHSGPAVYGVIAETNREELLSWLGPWLELGLGLALVWAMLIGLALAQLWRRDWRWSGRTRSLTLLGLSLTGLIALGLDAGGRAADAELKAFHDLQGHGAVLHDLAGVQAAPGDDLRSLAEASYPWGLPLRLWRWAEHRKAVQARQLAVAGHDFGVQWSVDAQAAQLHVLVIGESSRPDRWRLFGAERDTTPRLSALSDGELLRFDNAVSAASATRESLSLMLTRRPPTGPLAMTAEPSLLGAFRQAGFRTYWLSTQGAAGGHETPVSALAAEADERRYFNAADYRSAGALDGALLPALRQVLNRGEPRVLVVLHTLGSHLHYAQRYPPTFEHFRPALPRGEPANIWMRDRVDELLNAYDNSLRYTDHVLAEAIDQLRRRGVAATLTYVADHGETFWDGGCRSGGHGFAAFANYRIPLLIWASAAWREQHAARWARLQQRRQAPVSSLALFPTLTAMAGFAVQGAHAHVDLGASDWQPAPRWLAYYGDFDRQLSRAACDASPSTASAAATAEAQAAASAVRGETH